MFTALMFAAALAASTPLPPSPPVVITRPDWAEKPSGEDLGNHYPIRAWDEDIDGRAVMECRVTSSGQLNNCRVTSEEPAGYGFGNAAIGMSGLFRMKPFTVDGQAVSGAWVRIGIAFRVPAPDPEGTLEDTIQCYGMFKAELDAHPQAGALARAVQWYEASAFGQAETLKVPRTELRRRLDAARSSPTQDANLIDWCRTVD